MPNSSVTSLMDESHVQIPKATLYQYMMYRILHIQNNMQLKFIRDFGIRMGIPK
jgi:hypothetical protein